ncbi:MAG: ABC transporter permease [Longimicrobiales bacterium]
MRTGRLLGQAMKGLTRNRLRAFFMMAGIMVGITVLTSVLSAGMGARERIMERVRVFGFESMMIWAGPPTDQSRMGGGEASGAAVTATLKMEDAEAIRAEVGGIREVAPFARQGQSEVSWQGRTFESPVFGVTPEWLGVWDWPVERGGFITDQDNEDMARVASLGPTVVHELFGDEDPMGEVIQVGGVPFEVTGILGAKGTSAGGGDMDNRVYVPLVTYQRRVANIDYLSGIRAQVKDLRDMDAAVADIATLLRERHGIAPGEVDDFRITTPTEITAMVEEMQGTFNLFLIVVAAIALVVGGVVVANIMLLSVGERRKEIGLRLALGAKAKDIRRQFLVESALVTFLGGVAGILLGLVVNLVLERVTDTPAVLTWHVLAVGVVFSTAVGVLAGLHPARTAAAMTPVDALRS